MQWRILNMIKHMQLHCLISLTKFCAEMFLSTHSHQQTLGCVCSNFNSAISKHMLQSRFIWRSSEIALMWMPQNIFDDKSALVQVMACCHQATSHYLSQCWPRWILPYGITRPQFEKLYWSSMCSSSVRSHYSHITTVLRITSNATICEGNPGPVDSPHKGPLMWKFISMSWHHREVMKFSVISLQM